jgi:hypothetical protein
MSLFSGPTRPHLPELIAVPGFVGNDGIEFRRETKLPRRLCLLAPLAVAVAVQGLFLRSDAAGLGLNLSEVEDQGRVSARTLRSASRTRACSATLSAFQSRQGRSRPRRVKTAE